MSQSERATSAGHGPSASFSGRSNAPQPGAVASREWSRKSTNVSTPSEQQTRDRLYYVACPRCGSTVKQPFNRLGGPTISSHWCGRSHRPEQVNFIVSASGVGYVQYQFERGERWEPVFDRWIGYWFEKLQVTVLTQHTQESKLLTG